MIGIMNMRSPTPAKMAQTTPVWKSLSASLRKAKKTTTSCITMTWRMRYARDQNVVFEITDAQCHVRSRAQSCAPCAVRRPGASGGSVKGRAFRAAWLAAERARKVGMASQPKPQSAKALT
jgi:hypothetical protein